MKRYFTNKARTSAIEQIDRLIELVATAPGNVISYLDAHAIIDILADRRDDLAEEIRLNKEES